ncbi:MAG: DUF4249 family protein [Ignavibacteriaceae bacterium]|jgi:hypothetical protein
MKSTLFIIFTLPAVIFYSCEVPFNPNAPIRQRYVLTGIMRNDTSIQIVTLTKSYQPSVGLNPISNTEDPSVTDAEVDIWYRDTLYELRDSSVMRTDTSQYKDSVHFYYAKNLQPAAGEYVDIQAILHNGIVLQATTQMPAVSQSDFFDADDDVTIPSTAGRSFIYIGWQAIANVYYQPRIVIDYYIKGSTDLQTKVVPLYYITENGNQTPVYPTQTTENFFDIDTSVINNALNEIPQNGLSKFNYTIADIDIQMIVYDEYLSTYFSSLQEGADAFTVQLNQPDYTNIQGGYGIFASYIRTDLYIRFTADYLSSLGYY